MSHTTTGSSTREGWPAEASLSRVHREELAASAISGEVATARGYTTLDRPSRAAPEGGMNSYERLQQLGFSKRVLDPENAAPWPHLLIPMYSPTGTRTGAQLKPRLGPLRNGKRVKYLSPKGRAAQLDVHPWHRDAIADPTRDLWVIEGVKKADALTSAGEVALALTGVFMWRSRATTLGDWESVALKGRTVWLCFDSDTHTNRTVAAAMRRLGAFLGSRGATVRYVVVPTDGSEDKMGADDYLAAGGRLDGLRAVATRTAPDPGAQDDTFSDARMAERLAADVLDGEFLWTAGLGWVRWDGTRWAPVTEVNAGEAVRRWALEQMGKAVAEHRAGTGSTDAVRGWQSMLSASRETAVLKLARGIVETDAGRFDSDPFLLNTPGGVIDLMTMETLEHDPEYLMTKITSVGWRPDAVHPAWESALRAIPDGLEHWLRIRLGQALTGWMTPDDKVLLLTGGGDNGKTTIMDTVFSVLGGYAVNVPSTVILAKGKAQGQATPEKMTLMGCRLAYIEETPEGRHLDVQMLREVAGTPNMNGRHLYKGIVDWRASHTMIINTNHPPVVTETDHGTWKRLLRVDFPYRYRRPGEPLERPGDRHGDPTLRAQLETSGAREACLAWLLAGTAEHMLAGRVMPETPEAVRASVLAWRGESDTILRFLQEACVFDLRRWTPSAPIYAAFREWCVTNGNQVISSRTFVDRVRSHTGLPIVVDYRQVRINSEGLSLPPGVSTDSFGGKPWAFVGLAYAV